MWDKRWVVLRDNEVRVYTDDTEHGNPLDEFELCPRHALVSVHSAVTGAELTSTAASDLPYILRLEMEPHTTCWPGR